MTLFILSVIIFLIGCGFSGHAKRNQKVTRKSNPAMKAARKRKAIANLRF